MPLSLSSRVSIPPDVLVQELDGEAAILDLGTSTYFGLNETGTRMWQELASGRSLREAYETLLAEYEVGAETLRRELLGLVGRLAEKGLVEVVED